MTKEFKISFIIVYICTIISIILNNLEKLLE